VHELRSLNRSSYRRHECSCCIHLSYAPVRLSCTPAASGLHLKPPGTGEHRILVMWLGWEQAPRRPFGSCLATALVSSIALRWLGPMDKDEDGRPSGSSRVCCGSAGTNLGSGSLPSYRGAARAPAWGVTGSLPLSRPHRMAAMLRLYLLRRGAPADPAAVPTHRMAGRCGSQGGAGIEGRSAAFGGASPSSPWSGTGAG
jgi:hypothetical protein